MEICHSVSLNTVNIESEKSVKKYKTYGVHTHPFNDHLRRESLSRGFRRLTPWYMVRQERSDEISGNENSDGFKRTHRSMLARQIVSTLNDSSTGCVSHIDGTK